MEKKWYISKTHWFNIITLAIGIIQLVSTVYVIPTEVLTIVVGVGNLILRQISDTKIQNSII